MSRRLDEFFAAARQEPGPTEHEVRTLVARAWPDGRLRRVLSLLGIGCLVAGAVVAVDRFSGESVPLQRVETPDSMPASPERSSVNSAQVVPIQTQLLGEDTMRPARMKGLVATTVAAAGLALNATAQQATPPVRHDAPGSKTERAETLVQQFAEKLGGKIADFWTTRLNAYKVRIDRTLSQADRDALDRLRVRFGVMVRDEGIKAATSVQADSVELESIEPRNGGVELSLGIHASGEGMEVLTLFEGARTISRGYRPDFDGLRETVFGDIAEFATVLKREAQTFIRDHESEVKALTEGKDLFDELDKMETTIQQLGSSDEKMIGMVYGFAIEPLIMLYNGGDLREMFGETGLVKGAVTGITLPEQRVLLQSVPNPVANEAMIPFDLDDESFRTTLRVYSSTGELVATQDLGARPAGEHTSRIDMSAQAPGVYLYQLTIETSRGEQVYSRRMQVVR